MNGLPYYKAYPRDFIEGTIGMPFEDKCAYRVVLDLIYMQGGNLPDDARYISGLLGCSIRKWNSIRSRLVDGGKLRVSGAFLTNYRAVKELETLAKLQDKQRENASGPRKNKDLEKPRLSHTEPEPEPKGEERAQAREAPPSKFQEFWDGYPASGRTGASKPAALDAWRALGEDDQAEALGALAGLVRLQSGAGAPYCPHPSTFLRERRFESFAAPAQPARKALPPPPPPDDTDTWRRFVGYFVRHDDWRLDCPAPGRAGCPAPPGILREFGLRVPDGVDLAGAA